MQGNHQKQGSRRSGKKARNSKKQGKEGQGRESVDNKWTDGNLGCSNLEPMKPMRFVCECAYGTRRSGHLVASRHPSGRLTHLLHCCARNPCSWAGTERNQGRPSHNHNHNFHKKFCKADAASKRHLMTHQMLGSVLAERIFCGFLFLGRRIFSRILSPDFFSSFLWEKVPRKILQVNPRQNPPNFIQQKSPTHFCRGAGPTDDFLRFLFVPLCGKGI